MHFSEELKELDDIATLLNPQERLDIDVREHLPEPSTLPPIFTRHVRYSVLISSRQGNFEFPLGYSTLCYGSDEPHALGERNSQEARNHLLSLMDYLDGRSQPYIVNCTAAPSMGSLFSTSPRKD